MKRDMNKRMNRTQRNYIIVGLCAILLIMVVGYAAFQSQLKISGTSNITSNFLVKITDIQVSSKSGGAADKSDVTKVTSDTSATFGTTLQSPGDSITYDITIENQGTIDAVLKTINKTDASNSAIIFETSGVNEGDELLHGETATMQVTVTYNPSVTSQPSNLNSTLKLSLDYAQVGTAVEPGADNVFLGGQLVELVTSGDGLYADTYETGKYIYKGANPNNYITFNNELWRIIAREVDGTYKIMRNESIGNFSWDSSGLNNWDRPSDIKTYLNGDYLDMIKTNKDKIVSHTWSIGAVTSGNNDLANQIITENGAQSQIASVGMITASEYLKANSNIEQCASMGINNTNNSICKTTNWMYSIVPSGSYLWTISPYDGNNSIVFYISDVTGSAGRVRNNYVYRGTYGVSPVLYLSSDITLIGEGTQGNPYVIS